MESYKLLSPDLNNAIIASLTQITQQLVSISNGTPFQNVNVQSNAPFKPTASAIRINLTWFLSLVLSLTHALSVARLYTGFAQHHEARHENTRTLHRIERSRPPRIVDSMLTLHLSIFLFIAGLIDFLFLTNKIVAFCVLGYITAFSFACLVFTTLPSLYPDNRRRTSLLGIAWCIFLIVILAVLVAVAEIGGLFRGFLFSTWNRAPPCVPEQPSALATWRDALEGRIRKTLRSPADGLRQSISLNPTAVQSSVDVDASPPSQTLSTLDQDQKIKDFVSRIPGVIGSGAVPCTSSPILSSNDAPPDLSTSDPILGSCFHDFIDTCIPDTSVLTEESRGNKLRTSLKSLWYCGRAYHRLGNSAPLSHCVREILASPEVTGRIQNEADPTARVIGRCFASLIVKKLSSDANARNGTGLHFNDAELASLSAILGTNGEMVDRFDQPGFIGLANIISLLSREIDTLLDGNVPPDVEQIVQETVIILGTEALCAKKSIGAELPLVLVAQFRVVVSKVANAPAPEWLRILLKQISEGIPTVPSEQGR